MLRKEILDILEVSIDYKLSQKEIKEILNLNKEFYNESELDNFIIELKKELDLD